MAIKINFDLVNNPELSTFILAKKNCDKIGMLDVVHPVLDANLNNASEITFDVYKTVDGKDCAIWDEITDFKLVWCKEWDAWFEITVEINDSDKNNIYKSVIGKSLCESELSQVSLHNIEINTEDDIARDDYEKPTVFYNENPEISLLNRITEKIPHYHLGHIDNSLKNVQKTFSFDNITIYDALQEIAEEVGCIFIFDSGTDAETGKAARTIKAYDLMTYCKHCGNRDTFETKCPNCGTENTDYFILPYSQMQDDGGSPFKDTTIYISKDNFADEILYSVNTDKVKNCFKLVAGDDLMTATIKSCNPNGSEYIWYISDSMKKDMSDELKIKIEEYDALYDGYRSGSNFRCQSSDSSGDYYIPAYLLDYYDDYYDEYHELNSDIKPIGDAEDITNFTKLTAAYYNTVDMLMLLENSLMPTGSQYEDAQEVVDSLYANLIQPVPMTILNATTKDVVVENAVKYMVEAVIDPYYGVTVVTNTIDKRNDIPYRWYGNIIVTNINDSEDTATYTDLRLDLCDYTDCSAAYISQKIQTAIKTSSVANYGVNQLFAFYTENDGKNIGEFKMSLSDFKKKLKLYSLNNLVSFQDACQSVLNILAEQGVGNKTSGYTGLYSNSSTSNYTLYNDYYKRWKALETELNERETQIAHMEALQGYIVDIRNTIQDILNFEKFLADADLWKEFSSFRREDTYSNSNYISEGLNNSELIAWATEFIEVATKELYKSGELQHSISSSLKNLLLMKEFKPLVDYFELGNYIRVKIDDEVYRLRLIEYKIDWDNLDDIYVEFSDITRVVDGMTDLESLLNQSRSMATSYGNVQRQAKRGNKGYGRLTDWVDNGLDVTNQKIVNEVDNNVMSWDAHGILMREYDPVTETYANKQVKITNKGLYVTDDAWESAKVGVGNFIYYDPKEEEYYETFGVIADTLVGNLILSKEVGIYSEKNDITLNDSGIIISNAPYAEYSATGETKIVINPNSDSPFRITHGTHSVIRVDNDGTLYVNRKLNVHDAFKVNNSGDIDMDGDITMDGNIYIKGNITWGNETGVIQTLYSSQEDKSAPTHPYSYYSLTSSSGDSSWHRQFTPSRDKCIARYIYDEENDKWTWFVENITFLTHIDAEGIYTGTVVANNVQTGVLSTKLFTKNDANNDYGYMELYKQMIFFNENDSGGTKGDTKMAIGFLKGSQYNEPIIVMGAGDNSGSNVAYINKGSSTFDLFYYGDRNSTPKKLAYIRMNQNGSIRINGVDFPVASDTDTVKIDLETKAEYWNNKLSAVKSTINNRSVYTLKDDSDANADIDIGSLGQLCYVENNKIHFNPNVVLDWNAVYVLYGRSNYATPTNAYSTYPSTSSSGWHKTLDTTNDYYASYSYDGGNTWSAAIKTQGSDGSDGADGKDGKDGSDANVPDYIKSTYIDFDEVASPQIKGNFVMGGKVYGGEYWNTDEKAYIKVGTSTGNYGDLALYSKNNATPRYQIYDNATSIDFRALGTMFMYSSGSTTYPNGTWDFSNATVTGLSSSSTPKFG